jgi:Domain of unknown function (DUF4160)
VAAILHVLGFGFFFYSLEPGEPPHVHVAHGSKAAKYWLEPVELANSEGFRAHELTRLRELVIEHRDVFRRKWDEYHRS